MSDFHQGIIPTIHDLGTDIETLEKRIKKYSRDKPIALILPITPTETKGPAIKGIIKELKEINYINEFIIPFGREGSEDPKQLDELKELVSPLPKRKKIIWNLGPNIEKLYDELKKNDLDPGKDGKGRSVWMSYGYILANKRYKKSQIIALHDCDIIDYKKDLIAKLVYPIISETINSEFNKAYYSRHTTKMYGRVTRLFVTPFVKSLETIAQNKYHPESDVVRFIRYLNGFRYPLAGEFAMNISLALNNRIPSDWGLEVGTLAQVFHNYKIKRICQTDLGIYEHKHQKLSADDTSIGLNKMSIDIAKSVVRTLIGFGMEFSKSTFDSLSTTFGRIAREHIENYEADSQFNKLNYDYAEEDENIKTFEKAITEAGKEILRNPHITNLIPNWKTVIAKLPRFTDKLYKAVEQDSKGL